MYTLSMFIGVDRGVGVGDGNGTGTFSVSGTDGKSSKKLYLSTCCSPNVFLRAFLVERDRDGGRERDRTESTWLRILRNICRIEHCI